ncbi:MAG: 5'/3'-nucleotidase SurE [bacterium]
MEKPIIFVTNDDGIRSPGLRAAVEAVLPLGKIVVVAPTRQGTSMGRCLRGDREQALQAIELEVAGQAITAYHIDCSPAMAVKHGLEVLHHKRPPALIVSGINYGENLGIHITHSGTVGAALQGAGKGVPALAASLQTEFQYHFNYGDLNWHGAIHFVRLFAKVLLAQTLPFDVDLLKLDVPEDATPHTPWRLTRLSRQSYYTANIDSPTLASRIGDAKLQIEIDEATLEADSDVRAVAIDKVVSVTPLSLDLTARVDFDELEGSLKRMALEPEI